MLRGKLNSAALQSAMSTLSRSIESVRRLAALTPSSERESEPTRRMFSRPSEPGANPTRSGGGGTRLWFGEESGPCVGVSSRVSVGSAVAGTSLRTGVGVCRQAEAGTALRRSSASSARSCGREGRNGDDRRCLTGEAGGELPVGEAVHARARRAARSPARPAPPGRAGAGTRSGRPKPRQRPAPCNDLRVDHRGHVVEQKGEVEDEQCRSALLGREQLRYRLGAAQQQQSAPAMNDDHRDGPDQSAAVSRA